MASTKVNNRVTYFNFIMSMTNGFNIGRTISDALMQRRCN